MTGKPRCAELVSRSHMFSGSRCLNIATIQEDGKEWWCYRHSPTAKKKRNEEIDRRVEQQISDSNRRVAQQTKMARRARIYPSLMKALATIRDECCCRAEQHGRYGRGSCSAGIAKRAYNRARRAKKKSDT